MAKNDSMVESCGRICLGSLEGIVDSKAGIVDSMAGRFFSRRERLNECLTSFAVLSKKECSRQNWSFADSGQSLLKSPLVNGRGRTHSEPIGGGRAPKNKSSDVVTLSKREGAGGFSKRKREREPQRMMMIVTGNKRALTLRR